MSSPHVIALSYSIATTCIPDSNIATRLIIDGNEDYHFRAISGNYQFHTHSVSGFLYLNAGLHQIQVQYRTPGNFTAIPFGDWNIGSLQINY